MDARLNGPARARVAFEEFREAHGRGRTRGSLLLDSAQIAAQNFRPRRFPHARHLQI